MCRTEKRSLYNYFALKLETVRLNQSAIELIVQLESDYTKFVIQGLRESLLICFASTFSRVMTFSRYIGNSGLPDCFPYVGFRYTGGRYTVEPRYNEVPRDWHSVFVITGVRYIGVLLHTFYYYWAEEYGSSYRGLRYIGVCHIGVFVISGLHCTGLTNMVLYTGVFVISGFHCIGVLFSRFFIV